MSAQRLIGITAEFAKALAEYESHDKRAQRLIGITAEFATATGIAERSLAMGLNEFAGYVAVAVRGFSVYVC